MEIKHKTFGSVSSEPEVKQMAQPDLRSLIELGCIKDETEIGGMVFRMRSLNASERFELAERLGSDPTPQSLFDCNLRLLAHSIEAVNGVKLEDFYTGKGEGDLLAVRCSILASLQTPVINKLFDFYQQITERCDAQFGLEQVKK